MNNIQNFIVQPNQIATLKQSGLTEEQRRAFAQRVVSLVLNNPSLQNLDPLSVFSVALKMETLGVYPELETAYIVPYGNKAQFQIGYKGLQELAMKTGLYKTIKCVEVKESDYINYDINQDVYSWREDKLNFQEMLNRKEEPTMGYRAFAVLQNDTKLELFMTMDEIGKHHQSYSKAYSKKDKDGNVFNGASRQAMDRKMVLKLFINRNLVKSMDTKKSETLREVIKLDQATFDKDNKIEYSDKKEELTIADWGDKIEQETKLKRQEDTNKRFEERQLQTPTERQIEYMTEYNLHDTPTKLNFGEASELIGVHKSLVDINGVKIKEIK